MNVVLFLTLLTAAFGLAIRFGGAPERWTAAMFVAAAFASHLVYTAPAVRYSSVERAVAFVDLTLLAGLTVILIRADRFWPILMFAVHGVTVLSHLIKSIDASIVRRAYVIAIAAPGYATLLLLICAVARHHQRKRLSGDDPDWSRRELPEP